MILAGQLHGTPTSHKLPPSAPILGGPPGGNEAQVMTADSHNLPAEAKLFSYADIVFRFNLCTVCLFAFRFRSKFVLIWMFGYGYVRSEITKGL